MAAQATGLDSFLARGSDAGGSVAPASGSTQQPSEKVDTVAPAAGGASTATTAASEAGEAQDFDPNDPAEKTPEQRAGLRKALDAERKKRQELARQLAERDGKLQAYEKLQPKQQEQQPENEDDKFFPAPSKYIKDVSATTAKNEAAAVRDEFRKREMLRSEMAAKRQFSDYEEVMTSFNEAVESDPKLLQTFRLAVQNSTEADIDPAGFAYNYAKTYREVQNVGSMAELRNKIEAELRQKLEAEYRKKGALAAAEQASTSSAAAAGPGTTSPIVAGDRPIGDILRDR